MPALFNGLPYLMVGPAGILTTLKAGLAVKFFWLTAILAGAGFLLFGATKPGFKESAKQQFDKANEWIRNVGKDDEWDRFFEENGTS